MHAVEDFSGSAISVATPHVRFRIARCSQILRQGRRSSGAARSKTASPRQRIAFLVGAPTYLSLTWPGEVIAEDASSGQWGETVKRFLTAA